MIEGRIIKGVGGLYTVATDIGLFKCSVRGIFRKNNFTPSIGDLVFIELEDEEKRTAVISRFRERKTELVRPRVANIDQAILVFAAARPSINTDMLDRFLLLVEERGLDVLICINKIDLTDKYTAVEQLYKDAGYRVLPVSAKTGGGIVDLRNEVDKKVSVLAGPSGVGKSSIVNMLLASDKMQTGELSLKIDRGKHTTRHAELMEVAGGSYIVDTPGFTSLSLEHITLEALERLFREFRPYLGRCRFNDCRHINEPDCSVKAQVGRDIDQARYEQYVRIWNEINER